MFTEAFYKSKKYLSYLLFSLIFLNSTNIYANENKGIEENFLVANTLQNNNRIKSEYLLGHGDTLIIRFEGLPIFSNFYTINQEGYLILPEIGKIFAKGLTTTELNAKLEEDYKEIIINPKFLIEIEEYRPISVYISGEVSNPGLYNMEYEKELSRNNSQEKNIARGFNSSPGPFSTIKTLKSPRLYDLLKEANGVTNYADLSNVTVIRNNSKRQGGGKIKAKIDLLSLIINGDHSQNIRLIDGDSINIPKSSNIIKEQMLTISKTNFNPEIITIYITGNVMSQGPIELKRGSSLTQAIASSGGKKIWTGNVEFIRFNDDGTVNKNKFRYKENAPINTPKNPILMDGDIINVKRTVLGNTAEVIKEVSSPIIGGYGLYTIFSK